MASELLSCISPFLRHLRNQRSFKVIHFGGNRKPAVHDYNRPLIVGANFHSIFNRFGDIAGFIRPEPTVQVSK